MVKPGLVTAGVFCFIFAWNAFTFPLLLSDARAQTSTVVALRFLAPGNVHYGQVAAAATISALPAVILVLLIQKHLVRGLSFGAIRG